ncbi:MULTISPECIES: putative lipid II flippase FtsW [unclassified Campylobacter]|uniref:putative lipid II flippase FtsW n=1 Tax=unclassified Campylobacter TaxID=2593542 RepID=UPI001237C10D|nr:MULTISPECIES: putative lipid II flippase FtsW [unclassified Campylobacter]KAA6224660.1 putative lipid II flippase FtsW [Campylobacter sp. LR185c]KAA6225660.1 putative lipid II flippase FtsW [Campylobacter sp. LR286c]KAA6225780.1 putative lipid II flippase FtsW [Campylobacter sp. LR196d]KAA6229633.1 putative lipid II flippase FtsW [Campylobacter sp. LR291e]KAA6230122.1 putative lipid II flippase FtsW [Campylobacter sp. LR264d]
MCADKKLFYSSSVLITIGIIFSYSLSSFAVLYFEYDDFHFFIRQLFFGLSGILIMFLLSQLNPDSPYANKFIIFVLLISFISIIILPFLPTSLATASGGAKRWIRLGPISVSPVEFFKIGLIYFLAWSYTRRINDDKKAIKNEILILLPYLIVSTLIIGYIYFTQNDLGQSIISLFLVFSLAFFAGTSKRLFALGGVFVFIIGLMVIFSNQRRIERIKSWWGNIQDAFLPIFPEWMSVALKVSEKNEPYQISHSLNAIAHGGFFGEGLGLGTFKLGFLSEVHTDFVLSGITEEIGLVGLGFICVLYLYMILRILRIAGRCEKKEHFIFCSGIALLLLFSFFMNAFGVISLTPLKGVAVPLLSYGGSSMWAICIGLGYVLMISKKVKL